MWVRVSAAIADKHSCLFVGVYLVALDGWSPTALHHNSTATITKDLIVLNSALAVMARAETFELFSEIN